MALKAQSLILWGLQVTNENQNLPFQNVSAGPQINAVLTPGYYSLTSLLTEVQRALRAADSANAYTVTADRTVAGGLQNRVTIATPGSFLSILFGTGTTASTSCATLLGFPSTDQTGATSYTGTSTCGTALVPTYIGYNFLPPTRYRTVQGMVNISASGVKEAVVFQIQQFIKVQFKYETEANVDANWSPFWDWAIQQRAFDFTPEVTSPGNFYPVTMEKTQQDSKAIGFQMMEMLPNFPFYYDTGPLEMRVVLS